MKRSDIRPMPAYFDRYIQLATDVEVREALQLSLKELSHLPLDKWSALGDRVYAPGKWTLKDIIQHITDTERVFTYRALCLARKDYEKKPSFDENQFAANAKAGSRSLNDLINELKLVRQGTIALYQSFDEDVLADSHVGFENGYTVLAIAYIIIGHQRHHLNILEERYYPMLDQSL